MQCPASAALLSLVPLHVQVYEGRESCAAKTSAVGKAVALAVMDRPPQQQCGQQALVNPAQNRLLANTVAADMLSSLLADLHQVILQLFWLAQSIAYQVVLDMLDGSSMLILHPHCLLVLRQVVPCFES